MNKCPRCSLNLNEMTKQEAISQLKELIEDRKSFMAGDYDECFEKDVQALEYAIKELERAAQEVPVQEHSERLEVVNKKLNINIEVECIDLNELREVVDKIKDIVEKECNCTCTLNVKINH